MWLLKKLSVRMLFITLLLSASVLQGSELGELGSRDFYSRCVL